MDRRRNVGPELSVRPLSLNAATFPASEKRVLLDAEYKRLDGRYPEQLRPLTVRTKIVSRAPGSSFVQVGGNKVVCSVYGPRSGSTRTASRAYNALGTVSCEINYAPFSSLQRVPHQPV